MAVSKHSLRIWLVVLAVSALAFAADLDWNWRNQETVGRTDPGVNTTSKLTEADRAALIDEIVLHLQKPLSQQGYEDDRIREIASTTRLRFVDLGDGKPVILASSLGLEGGCDALVNCPFWIFRRDQDGYVSLLDTFAATYTIQPTRSNGMSDLVIARHLTATDSRLALYTFANGKYREVGCYRATWPAAKDGEVQDPTIAPCPAEDRQTTP